jgi:multicomponent K+:H+ antiporter subunit D
MTKVGLYAIYRVFGGIFGDEAGALANLGVAWIWPLAIATLIIGMLGALSAQSLRQLASYAVILSVGTLLLSFVVNDGQALGAGLYYLIHSTLACAALFLIADQIQVQRGPAKDRFVVARPMRQAGIVGSFYFIAAIAIVGLPPLSGFVGKALILQRVVEQPEQIWVWPAILVSSLLILVAFSRAGTSLFWHLSGNKPGTEKASKAQITAIALLLLATPVLTIFAGPVSTYTEQAAADIQVSKEKVLEAIAAIEEIEHDTH